MPIFSGSNGRTNRFGFGLPMPFILTTIIRTVVNTMKTSPTRTIGIDRITSRLVDPGRPVQTSSSPGSSSIVGHVSGSAGNPSSSSSRSTGFIMRVILRLHHVGIERTPGRACSRLSIDQAYMVLPSIATSMALRMSRRQAIVPPVWLLSGSSRNLPCLRIVPSTSGAYNSLKWGGRPAPGLGGMIDSKTIRVVEDRSHWRGIAGDPSPRRGGFDSRSRLDRVRGTEQRGRIWRARGGPGMIPVRAHAEESHCEPGAVVGRGTGGETRRRPA